MGEYTVAFKIMAAQLATMLELQGDKGWHEWSQLHRKLAEVAAAAASDDPGKAVQALLEVAKDASSSKALMRALEERVSKANIKDLLLLVADELNMTPLCDSEPVHMVHDGHFCQENVDRIIKSSTELSAPNAPYAVISSIGDQVDRKRYLLNCLFGTTFPVMGSLESSWLMSRLPRFGTTGEIMISRCIGPSLLLLEVDYLDQATDFDKPFVLTVSDLVIVDMSVDDIHWDEGYAKSIFRKIFQERTKLHSEGLTNILVVLHNYDGKTLLDILRSDLLESLGKIWESVNEESVQLKDYIKINIVGLPDNKSPEFPEEVTVLRKLLSNNKSAKVKASSFSLTSRISWEAIVLKDEAARLKFQGGKWGEAWRQFHSNLAEAAIAITGKNTRMAVEALKLAKDASSSKAWVRIFEDREANLALLKDLILTVASTLDMTPLCDSEPIHMVDEDGYFCERNVDHIIHCSTELSAINAPYAVISIIGGQRSGKSYLLNHIFGTKFPEMDNGQGRSRTTRGIIISTCIGPSLLLLDFEGFRISRQGQDTTFQKKATLFALTVSDLVMVNMPLFDICQPEGYATLLFRIIFQERTKLPQRVTKILVVVRDYDGKQPFETLRTNVEIFLEKIWESVVEYVKFKDYIEVNIVGLPDKNSRKFPMEVTLLRQLLSNNISTKVPSSGFSLRSSTLWDTIQGNKELDIHQFYPGESIFPPKSGINSSSRFSSGIEPKAYTYSELQHMTNDFSEERLIGTGGFGKVYKGVLDNGEVIAIKKLYNNPKLVEKSYQNELLNLMMVQHRNIIKLVGYCSETRDKVVQHEGKLVIAGEQERALCLEYMEGGTLDELLSDESCGLDWEARYNIIKGMCHGLNHLQIGSKDLIYHLDLKPVNILMDEDRTPKIGDFGLSTLLDSAGTYISQVESGTRGYMPPEYIDKKLVSPKFDVFSLGVIIMEVIAGPNTYNNYKSEFTPSKEFTDRVTGNWRKREQAKPMSMEELLEVQKSIKIALRCVEDNRANRPFITDIVKELDITDADAGDDATPTVLSI